MMDHIQHPSTSRWLLGLCPAPSAPASLLPLLRHGISADASCDDDPVFDLSEEYHNALNFPSSSSSGVLRFHLVFSILYHLSRLYH